MKTRCTHGRAKWERSENVVEWKYAPLYPWILRFYLHSLFLSACLVLFAFLVLILQSSFLFLPKITFLDSLPHSAISRRFFASFSADSLPRFYYSGAYDRIARFVGGQEYSFSGEAELSSETNRKAWSRPPIGMEFSIVMFTSSGLLVRYLKVIEKSGYRYLTPFLSTIPSLPLPSCSNFLSSGSYSASCSSSHLALFPHSVSLPGIMAYGSSVKWVKYITRAARGGYEIRF